MAPHLIIAIPSYRRPESLGTLLQQLSEQEGNQPFTVFVLNDGGFLESQTLLESFKTPRFQLRFNATPTPSGLPRARNILLDTIAAWRSTFRHSPALVCFLDDDCEVNTKFVQEVYQAAMHYAAFCFRIETIGQSGIVNTMNNRLAQWILQPFIGRVVLPLGFIRGGYFARHARPRRVDHLPGGCLIYRFDTYPTLRFDEKLNDGNAILEDTDFSLALTRAGATLWYLGSYGITHRPGSVGGVRIDVPQEKYAYYWRHKRFLACKWCGTWALFTVFPLVLLESIVLSLAQSKWLVGVMVGAWFGKQTPRFPQSVLRIAAPQSGINPASTLGGEIYDASALKEIARHVDVEVILPRNKPFSDDGALWHVRMMPAIKSALGYYVNIYRALEKSYRTHPFSVVRVHSPYLTAIPVLLFAFTHKTVKTFASYLHMEEGILSRIISRLAVKRWDAIGVISEASKNELVALYGADPAKMVVTYPGVDDVYFAPLSLERLRDFKAERGLTNQFVILHLGSLITRKNISFLIDVLATLPPRAVLVIAGHGPERGRLERQALQNGCADRVCFPGNVSEEDKMMWMHAADVFALASHKEGFGMAVAQAGACGTPGIVANTYSLPEVVADGYTGAVRPLEVNAWRATLQTWMDNPALVERLGAQARAHVRENFSWEKAAVAQVKHMRAMVNEDSNIRT
ncbi:MAG: glycosyltransferase [Candidatus Magasanikbacteria bacterium]|nr:glycosyltransferase [Candidatus Magasanikbacteria bacterium]